MSIFVGDQKVKLHMLSSDTQNHLSVFKVKATYTDSNDQL